jgi:hypothetical protein
MGNQRTDANNRVVDMPWKLFLQCLTYFVIGFAVMTIGSGKTSQVWNRFNIPNKNGADILALLFL